MTYKIPENRFKENTFLIGLADYVKDNFPSKYVTLDTVLAYMADSYPEVKTFLEKNEKDVEAFITHERNIAERDARIYLTNLESQNKRSYYNPGYYGSEKDLLDENFPDISGLVFCGPGFRDHISRLFQVMETNKDNATPEFIFSGVAQISDDLLLHQSIFPLEGSSKKMHAHKQKKLSEAVPKEIPKTAKKPAPKPRGSHGSAIDNERKKPPEELDGGLGGASR